ncbi:coagulation factor VIII isoform 2-T2 [Discoglossus pictus]
MMGPLSWLLLCLLCHSSKATTRTYYIAAMDLNWDYRDSTLLSALRRPQAVKSPQVDLYQKAVYVEFTDASFKYTKPRPEWTGLLGPTIRAETYDSIVIHFKNLASRPYSLHGVGVSYGKSSEGMGYTDGTGQSEKTDEAVDPGAEHVYLWHIPESYGPTLFDPSCVTSAYYSHRIASNDTNAGLVGPILICKPGTLSEDGSQHGVQEKILLFAVFVESKNGGEEETVHTINGYTNSSLPEMILCYRKPLSLHVIGFGAHSEVHSISLEGHSFIMVGHRVNTLPVTAFTFLTASTQPGESGVYSLSCQTPSHPADGMAALVTIEVCAELPKMETQRSGAYDGEYNDEYYDSIVLELDEEPSPIQIRSHGKLKPATWRHYIAAMEVEWEYRPSSRGRTERSAPYTKAIYREFTDSSFLHKKESEIPGVGILGPVLRGEVGDQIQIVFKNLAQRPYNMHPHGIGIVSSEQPHLTVEQLKDQPVYPNQSITYIWHVTQHDAPTSTDQRCLTRFYSSSLHPKRDLASGLIGPLLICKKQTLTQRGNQVVTDRERLLFFSLFDERISWYKDINLQRLYGNSAEIQNLDRKTDELKPMHTVNGLVDSLHLSLCLNEVNLWHVLSLGLDTELLSLHFGGNTFRKDTCYQDTLTLFPQSGETLEMVIENTGQWTVAPLDPSAAALGMRALLSVAQCNLIDDGLYEYDYDGIYEDIMNEHPPLSPRGIPNKRHPLQPREQRKEKKIPGAEISNKIPPIFVEPYLDIKTKNKSEEPEKQRIETLTENISAKTEELETMGRTERKTAKEPERGTGESGAGIVEMENRIEELGAENEEKERQAGRVNKQMVSKELGTPTDEPEESNVTLGSKRSEPGAESEEHVLGTRNYVASTGSHMIGRIENVSGEPVSKKDSHAEETGSHVAWTEENVGGSEVHVAGAEEYVRQGGNRVKGTEVHVAGTGFRVEGTREPLLVTLKSEASGHGHELLTKYIETEQDEAEGLDNSKPDKSAHWTHEKRPSEDVQDLVNGYYDDYITADTEDIDMYGEEWDKDPRSHDEKIRTYYIAAVEEVWDYTGGKSPYFNRDTSCASGGFSWYKKVVFREYLNIQFLEPAKRGERDVHLGLLGPYIRAEINDVIIIHFKNMASRPYSFYSNLLYPLQQEEEEVAPQETRTYTARVSAQLGPTETGAQCRAWLYTSNVNSDKDFHSGLLGPFLACRPQVLSHSVDRQLSVQDFSLLFMEIDETQSWYLSENLQHHCTTECPSVSCPQTCNIQAPDFQSRHTFYAINGHIGDTLPGLVLPLHHTARWHLLTVGSREVLTIHFNGNILISRDPHERHLNLLNLYPGVSVTLEMTPQSAGLWRVGSAGKHQYCGLTALYLVYDPECRLPLGLSSGKIKDSQISASGHYGSWLPALARLHKSGSINAWSVDNVNSWIQVDLLNPTVVHAIHTQGARQRFTSLYINQFVIFYSLRGETWMQYKGNASANQMVFFGNIDASSTRENLFDPPLIARYLRLHPTHTGWRAALRMELFGCDISSCSLPLGLEKGDLPPQSFSASSHLYSVFSSWLPSLARLNLQGRVNAWRPQVDASSEWIQLDLGHRMKVTGLMIQGARSAFTHMFITHFSLSLSHDGHLWEPVRGPDGQTQIFQGSQDTDTPIWVSLEPPFMTRFLRLHPESWKGGIALRMEVLGCDSS